MIRPLTAALWRKLDGYTWDPCPECGKGGPRCAALDTDPEGATRGCWPPEAESVLTGLWFDCGHMAGTFEYRFLVNKDPDVQHVRIQPRYAREWPR